MQVGSSGKQAASGWNGRDKMESGGTRESKIGKLIDDLVVRSTLKSKSVRGWSGASRVDADLCLPERDPKLVPDERSLVP